MSTGTTGESQRFIAIGEARARLMMTSSQFSRLVKVGAVTTMRRPLCKPLVLEADVERFEREAIRPARVIISA